MTHRFGKVKKSEAPDLKMLFNKGPKRGLFRDFALKKLVGVWVDNESRKEPKYLVEYETSRNHTTIRVNTPARHQQALDYGVKLLQPHVEHDSPVHTYFDSPISSPHMSPVSSPHSSPAKTPVRVSSPMTPVRISPVNSPHISPVRISPVNSPVNSRTIVALVKMSHKTPAGTRVYKYFQSFGFDASNNPIYEEITKPHYDTLLKSHPHLGRTPSKRSKGVNARIRCDDNKRVKKLTYKKNPKTKRNVYKAICSGGSSRIITRAQYERYAKRKGVKTKALPVRPVSKRLPKRSNTIQYCDAYGNFYQNKCMAVIGDASVCEGIRTGRIEYCNQVGGRTKVSNRGCETIGMSTRQYNLFSKKYPKTEPESDSRGQLSRKRCENARTSRRPGKYTVTERPKPRKTSGILGFLNL